MTGWLEIDMAGASTRVDLKKGLTRIGSQGADVVLEHVSRGELHVWDEPPKAVYIGSGDPPRLNGRVLDEELLHDGDRIDWAGARLLFREEQVVAVVEELSREPLAPAAPVTLEAWDRVRAGMLVELGLTDRKVLKRWQDAVMRGEFSATACARDLLASSDVRQEDSRFTDRGGRLLRDFLMTPLTRGTKGAGRKLRGAARQGSAFALAQFIVVGVYTLILVVIMVLVRLKFDTSFDGWIDTLLGR